jgi:hypothetical protein
LPSAERALFIPARRADALARSFMILVIGVAI